MALDINTGFSTNSSSAAASQPANVVTPFVIVEDIPAGAITISLEDTDMPHGRARELSAFQSGGKVDIAQGGIYNPGSDRPVLQMMSVRENKLTIKGAFRDRIRAGAQRQQGGAEPNHARAMRDLVEQVRRRGNLLKITWNGDERSGVIEETVFDEEGPHDIGYSITFFITTPPTGVKPKNTDNLVQPTSSIEDLRANMAAKLAEQRAQALALATNAAAVSAISNSLGFVSNAIDTLGTMTTIMERQVLSTPQQIATAANNTISSAQSVQTQIENLRKEDRGLDKLPASQAMTNASIDAYMSWWVWQHTTEAQLDQTVDAMRQIKLQTLQQMRKATKLYRVQSGDTLESIAQSQLGSKARSSDLGIRPDQLVPGAYIRIPQAV